MITSPNSHKANVGKEKKLSIITINYNNRDGLRQTIESVVAQNARDFEYIVIDGGSTDGSVEVIKEYSEFINYWVSEPDKGIYNAMNKGVSAAKGIFCQFLNSGDILFASDTILSVLPLLSDDADIFTGYTCAVESGIIRRWKKRSPKEISFASLIKNSLSHPSSFIRKEFLEKIPYDESLRIVSDWKFFIQAHLSGARYRRLELDVALFDTTGISSTNQINHQKERDSVLSEFVNPVVYNEFEPIPDNVIYMYRDIRTAYRLQTVLNCICSSIVALYKFIFPNRINKTS